MRCARRCVAVDSLSAAGHTWLAGALGYLALEAGMSQQLSLSQELHREALRAIELDARNDAAYSILGSFYRALGNAGWLKRALASLFVGSVPEGGFEESESMLKKASELAPDVMRHKYELGILYLDTGRDDLAREVLEQAALLPVKTAIDRPRLAKIREILSGLAKYK
jgi:tetratricopeptide (TPR) repeat protein